MRLGLSRNVSSAGAHVGDSVDFEVLEDVAANGIVVIPKGSIAIGTVTEAQGKLEIVLDYVRLADTEKAALRAVKDAKGGSHVAGMTVGIVATGKDITVPKGAEVTGYVNGDVRLETKNFNAKTEQGDPPGPGSDPTASSAVPSGIPITGTIEVRSIPEGAEVYADAAFVGNAPATLKLAPGKHTIRVNQSGHKELFLEIAVRGGSELPMSQIWVHLSASRDKSE